MSNVLPAGISAIIQPCDPMYSRYVKHAMKKTSSGEYTWCDFCGHPLEESGMRLGGKLVVSAKTCRNPLCPMLDDTLNPDDHRQECAKRRGKRHAG